MCWLGPTLGPRWAQAGPGPTKNYFSWNVSKWFQEVANVSAITLNHPKHHQKSYLNVYACLDFRGPSRTQARPGPGPALGRARTQWGPSAGPTLYMNSNFSLKFNFGRMIMWKHFLWSEISQFDSQKAYRTGRTTILSPTHKTDFSLFFSLAWGCH